MSQTPEIEEHLKELRNELAIPKKNRPKDWEDLVGRLVGQIANDYASQKNHELALTELSLINLAASLGNKNAKKRVLKPSLWLDCAPPSINKVLLSLDEQKMGIKSLSSIKSDWVSLYILDELESLGEKKLIPVYLDWLLKHSSDLSGLLSVLNRNNFSPKQISREDWISDLLSYLIQVAPKQVITDEFIGELLKIISHAAIEKNSQDTLQIQVFELLNITSNYRPSILIATTMPSLLAVFEHGHQTKNKKLASLQETLAYKTLDILRAVSTFNNADGGELVQLLTGGLKKSIHKFDRIQSDFLSPEINGDSNKKSHESYETETTLVALISNWRDYLKSNPSNKGLDQLATRFNELLVHFSIVPVGEEGLTEAYDPFRHELLDEVGKNISTIKVVRPGFGKRREDGSTRILLKAITQAT
jgi:hypothetical protein